MGGEGGSKDGGQRLSKEDEEEVKMKNEMQVKVRVRVSVSSKQSVEWKWYDRWPQEGRRCWLGV